MHARTGKTLVILLLLAASENSAHVVLFARSDCVRTQPVRNRDPGGLR